MLTLHKLVAAVDGLALAEAVCQAWLGNTPWTPELAREHNRRWLAQHAPDRLARWPNLAEDGRCECGGICLLFDVTEMGLFHHCQLCGAHYRVTWAQYGGGDDAA